ncbi:MAG TPA: hypothetical protein PLU72_15995 [Candidatus Ozemobacteraceae bacterium]|nr:hypothetical protein [Candidatus Ozemobacteraceae bacterium]
MEMPRVSRRSAFVAALTCMVFFLASYCSVPLSADPDTIQKINQIFDMRLENELQLRQTHKEYLKYYKSDHPQDMQKTYELEAQMNILKEKGERLYHEYHWLLAKIPEPQKTQIVIANNVKEMEFFKKHSQSSSGNHRTD